MILNLDEGAWMDVCPQYRLAEPWASQSRTVIPDFVLRVLTAIRPAGKTTVIESSTALLVEVKRLYATVMEQGQRRCSSEARILNWLTESCDWNAWICLIERQNVSQALMQGYVSMCMNKTKKNHHLILIVGIFFTVLEFTQFEDAQLLSAGDVTDKDIITFLPFEHRPTVLFSNRPIFPRENDQPLLNADELAFNEGFVSSLISGVQAINHDQNILVGIARDDLPLFSNTVSDTTLVTDPKLYDFAQTIVDFYKVVAQEEAEAMQYRSSSNPLIESPPRNPKTNEPNPTWTRETDDYTPTPSRTKKSKRARNLSPKEAAEIQEQGQGLFNPPLTKKQRTRFIDQMKPKYTGPRSMISLKSQEKSLYGYMKEGGIEQRKHPECSRSIAPDRKSAQ
ncbi:hypothetical protein EV421DRAFT_1745762 [Armillaria borealis]|uniref:Uncharacterized protein n=1 Tax=Armillaria borealis TaxID=47425 RepID=A0AA39M5U9_9AGAR|nr:hypothetical protein EV421DRAFT_1745762 [Armillaria borealis]